MICLTIVYRCNAMHSARKIKSCWKRFNANAVLQSPSKNWAEPCWRKIQLGKNLGSSSTVTTSTTFRSAQRVMWSTATIIQRRYSVYREDGPRKPMLTRWNRWAAGAVGRKIPNGCAVKLFRVWDMWQDSTYFIIYRRIQDQEKLDRRQNKGF